MGVSWHKKSEKWRADIKVNGRNIHLGTFEDKQSALDARAAAEAKHGFHKNHVRTKA
jgi:hypothetical protein